MACRCSPLPSSGTISPVAGGTPAPGSVTSPAILAAPGTFIGSQSVTICLPCLLFWILVFLAVTSKEGR